MPASVAGMIGATFRRWTPSDLRRAALASNLSFATREETTREFRCGASAEICSGGDDRQRGAGPGGLTRAFEVLEEMGGSALAQAAGSAVRSVNIVAGTGGFARSASCGRQLQVGSSSARTSRTTARAADDDTSADSQVPLEGRPLYVRKSNGKPPGTSTASASWSRPGVAGPPNAHQVAPTCCQHQHPSQWRRYAGSAPRRHPGTLKALVPASASATTTARDMRPMARRRCAGGGLGGQRRLDGGGLFSSAAARPEQRLKNPSRTSRSSTCTIRPSWPDSNRR